VSLGDGFWMGRKWNQSLSGLVAAGNIDDPTLGVLRELPSKVESVWRGQLVSAIGVARHPSVLGVYVRAIAAQGWPVSAAKHMYESYLDKTVGKPPYPMLALLPREALMDDFGWALGDALARTFTHPDENLAFRHMLLELPPPVPEPKIVEVEVTVLISARWGVEVQEVVVRKDLTREHLDNLL